MAVPLLIDVDADTDGAIALYLAMALSALEVRAVVITPGDDASIDSLHRRLAVLNPSRMPALAGHVSSNTGRDRAAVPALEAYRTFLRSSGPRLIVTTGPLTSLAAALQAERDAIGEGLRLFVRGGAIWTRGDAGGHVESVFARDPVAAQSVVSSGLSVTVAPLDVTNYIVLDASHVAHLRASGNRTGALAADLLEPAVESESPPGPGTSYLAGAVTVAAAVRPDLFIRTRMRLDVEIAGSEAGRSKPALGGDRARQIDLLTAVNAVDLLEVLLGALCHEAFIV